MLAENKLKTILDLVANASNEELIWINGYLNGAVQQRLQLATASTTTATSESVPSVQKITILYGTETGNAKRLAADFAAKAKQARIHAKVAAMDQYRLSDFTKEEYVLAIVSTHGEGEPPVAARKFYDHLHNNGFQVPQLKYSVLALGDTAYPLFCKTGEDMDAQLHKIGGTRLEALQKCDLDFEDDANGWFQRVLSKLQEPSSILQTKPPVVPIKKTGKQIFTGTVLGKINLNDRGSNKETWHIEISAEGIDYLPGDSLGIVPENPTAIVEEMLQLVKANPETKVMFKNETVTLFQLLKEKINIIYLTERMVKQYADATGHAIPPGRADLLDLVKLYPVASPEQFIQIVSGFNAISPRLYTIASSPQAHPGEVHLLVVKDHYHIHNETRFGLCSDYLSRFEIEQTQTFFIQPNKRFRLPVPDRNTIMIGAGTGIAPFRSFLAERDATGATGKNWLFFGEQHFATDFLYQTELQQWFSSGVLSKIHLAFSRDQAHKIYVQYRMKEQAAELFNWLEQGAYLFICGRKDPMGRSVEAALLEIIAQEGELSADGAKGYLERLEEEGRFEKDVY